LEVCYERGQINNFILGIILTSLPHAFQADISMPDDQELLGRIIKQFRPMQNNGVDLAVPSLVV
jgi:hypothetical protein